MAEKESLADFQTRLSDSFFQRNVITYREAHFRTWHKWCAEYGYDQKEEHFMYHPRGRVSYFPPTNDFELVIDPCLLDEDSMVDRILSECGISRENTNIVTQSDDQSLHYVCHKCEPQSFDNKGRYKE